MYYLQSRYYNPEVGRFVNGDDAEFTGVNSIALGFNLLSYAYDFLKANGKWHWSGRKYSGMGKLRIAQKLWFHALIYYIGMPIQKVFKLIGVSWGWLNDKVARAQYMQINSGDSRA